MNDFIDNIFNGQGFKTYAHPGESIELHTDRCCEYFKKISEEKDLKSSVTKYANKKLMSSSPDISEFIWQMFKDITVFHDTGKATPEFQRKRMKNDNAPDIVVVDKTARHSMISAIIYLEYYLEKIKNSKFTPKDRKTLKKIVKINSYVISRHHGKLTKFKRFYDEMNGSYANTVMECLRKELLKGCSFKNITDKELRFKSNYDSFDYFYCRLAYSVLVACDYYAASENSSGIRKEEFGNVDFMKDLESDYESSQIQRSVRNFEKESYGRIDVEEISSINDIRSMILLEAERTYLHNPDDSIYFLQAPTGSGKSNIALDISLKMMKDRGRKLFYIYPFNTLVEQNRKNMEKMLSAKMYGNIAVVNSLTPIKIKEDEENRDRDYVTALLDRQFLNYPIILSTHVSFFDLLLGSKRESAFGFYQLSGAVVVLDEIQSYRNEVWGEMMIMLQCCAELLDMQIIIMSATLPDLTVLSGNKSKVTYLVDNPQKYFQLPAFRNRVEISTELLQINSFSLLSLKDHIVRNHKKGKRVLVEFMFKKTADEFYHMLREEDAVDVPVLCITGDDSIFEREKILQPIKKGDIQECILISTQVLEAGADIDMDIGYKNISKLDSEEQFLGRINRSCMRSGIVYFFNLDDAGRIYKNDYRMNEKLTLKNKEMEEILKNKEFDRYYSEVLKIIKKHKLENTSEKGLEAFEYDLLGSLDFPNIAERLKMIEEDNMAQDVFLCRTIELEDGMVIDGRNVWERYKKLLESNIPYAEMKVKLSEVRSVMSHFIYQIRPKSELYPNEQIGNLLFYENGEDFFKNGRLDRQKLEENDRLFF